MNDFYYAVYVELPSTVYDNAVTVHSKTFLLKEDAFEFAEGVLDTFVKAEVTVELCYNY